MFIAVAGRSNGLGPVLSGNATWPVLNCPPLSADWGAQDVWSSLRLPSGKLYVVCVKLPRVFDATFLVYINNYVVLYFFKQGMKLTDIFCIPY